MTAVGAAALGAVVFAAAFLGGRLTAPAHATPAPRLVPTRAGGTQASLPQLSQAAALPALAAAPQPQVRIRTVKVVTAPTPTTTAKARAKPAPKRPKAPTPVTIVGNG